MASKNRGFDMLATPATASRTRLRPLAAAFALALALDTTPPAALPAHAANAPRALVVSNCGDSGTGSLRDAVNNASDGDTIDLTQLQCSTISLSTGAILIGVADLTLQGPGNHQLMIQGYGGSGFGILYDVGGGTLTVNGVDISFGQKYRSDNTARGGCVYTNGNLNISDANVYACSVHSNSYPAYGGALAAYGSVSMESVTIGLCGLTTSGIAKGGGVFAGHDVFMRYSSVTGCRVATTGHGYGGGVFAGGNLTVKYSTIADNENDEAQFNFGGGTYSRGDVSVYWSTISGNSTKTGGGLFMRNYNNSVTANISESTISGNYAYAGAGVRTSIPTEIDNSTIAFNTDKRAYTFPIGYSQAAGLVLLGGSSATVQSSIIANNTLHGTNADEAADVGGDYSITVNGSANLIMTSSQPIPLDTITDDPQLAPLADNGGFSWTHAIYTGSPAVDRGNAGTFQYDQRGPGFARVLGSAADIGAFESNPNALPDRIFQNGFD